jgi:hypothetical protein
MTNVYDIKWKCERPFQAIDMTEPNLAQLDKVLYKMCAVVGYYVRLVVIVY